MSFDGGAVVSASSHLRGQEGFDNREFRLFDIGQFLTPALFIQRNRFAPLLDHFLQHFDDNRIVIRRGQIAGAQLRCRDS
jgi:hypothetical protein